MKAGKEVSQWNKEILARIERLELFLEYVHLYWEKFVSQCTTVIFPSEKGTPPNPRLARIFADPRLGVHNVYRYIPSTEDWKHGKVLRADGSPLFEDLLNYWKNKPQIDEQESNE